MVSLLSPFCSNGLCVVSRVARHISYDKQTHTHMLVTSDATHMFSHFAGFTLVTSKPHIVIMPVSPLTPACPFRRQFRSVGNELILEHCLHKRNARQFPRTLLTQTECSPIFRLVFSVLLLDSSVASSITFSHARLSGDIDHAFTHTFTRLYLLQSQCVCSLGSVWYVALPSLSTLTCPIGRYSA